MRPKYELEDNIRIDTERTAYEEIYWIHMAQDREPLRALVNTVMNHRVHGTQNSWLFQGPCSKEFVCYIRNQ
jgi:hypothetical protein